MLTDYFSPHTGGGVEQVAKELCRELVQRGHTVKVLTIRTRPALALETSPGLTVHRVPGIDVTRWLGLQQAVSLLMFGKSVQLIRSFRPDVIHAHNLFYRTTESAAVLRMVFRIPLITTLHLGKAEGSSKPLDALMRVYELTVGRFILQRSDHVTTVSNAVAEHARRISRHMAPPTVIPNGVDTSVFFSDPDQNDPKQVVLFVARLVTNKGPETLIRAAALVLARHPQARFVLAGDGPLRVRLQEHSRQLGMAKAVQFLGLRHDVPELMRQASIFVRPSTLEGMPLSVLEAMASELPVIATPVGGTPELVEDGVNGYLVPVNDHVALADSIIRLLDDPLMAKEMGQRGREMVEVAHTWGTMAAQTERVYLEEVRRRK